MCVLALGGAGESRGIQGVEGVVAYRRVNVVRSVISFSTERISRPAPLSEDVCIYS